MAYHFGLSVALDDFRDELLTFILTLDTQGEKRGRIEAVGSLGCSAGIVVFYHLRRSHRRRFDTNPCQYNHIIGNGTQALASAYRYLPVTGKDVRS